ncbi:MAG: tetratricopeptide repeat protein [Opitutaceae bacterium]|nr:tetratricopeptide repeat protein [Opitutaceae bacterium]
MSSEKNQRLLQLAVTHHRAGRLAEAGEAYAQLRRIDPRHFDAAHLGGTVALQLGQPAEAVKLLHQALRIDPKATVCEMRLALAYLALGQTEPAEAHLRKLLARLPTYHEAWDNLGMVLKSAGKVEDALAAHRRAIELQPRYAQGWYNLGVTNALLGRGAAALACHEHALAADASHSRARYGRAQALQQLHRIDEAIAGYEDQLSRHPDHHEARGSRLLALNYRDALPRETLFAEHAHYGELVEAMPAAVRGRQFAASKPVSRADRKLRVAFFSPDLRSHAVACFLEPLLRHLDRTQFEIVLYHDHYMVDAVSQRLQGMASLWRNVVGQPLESVEAALRADAPDVLVDLAGHTGFGRLPLFARRLAPVQITYLGYPNTTGLRTMDYRFTDVVADPPGESDAYHTERLVRFAPTAWTYQPPADTPDPLPLRCTQGGPITFGSFNNFAKVSDRTLALWGRILQAVPDSRLLLKSYTHTDLAFHARLNRCGLDSKRIEVLPPAATAAAHLRLYSEVDIALDTFPYHGTTTTCEALWMQRPVISLAGDRHASRVGASLLHAVGKDHWVAASGDDYVRIACELASDRTRLAEEAGTLRATLQSSALFDHAGQAALFGAALRACWSESLLRESPTAPAATAATAAA